jgi:hypothetical protein
MSYLFPEGSTTERGVVEIGSNINVLDGVISIPQSVETTAAVTFDKVSAISLLELDGKSVITRVTPAAGNGISITSLTGTGTGPSSSFTVNNTGVLSLVAGTGITVSAATGTITVSATGTDIIKTIGVTNNYTVTADDEYIGVDSTSLVTITLPAGVNGRVYTIKEEHSSGTGKVNIQGSNNEKIDGSAFKQLTALASLTVVFRAGQWRII